MTSVAERSSLQRRASAGDELSLLSNHLLFTLPPDERQRLRPHLRAVQYAVGDVLCETRHSPHIFPTTAIVSMLCLTLDGQCAEVAVVGRDGVVGPTPAALAVPSSLRWVVQTAGTAYELDGVTQVGDGLAGAMRCFTQALLAQVAQTAICNRFHSIEQQLSRRLLMGLDRSQDASLEMTHESAASLLGVRREGVTVAAQNLQRAGLIKYRRGRVDVLDRSRLEHRSCECYAAARWLQARPGCRTGLIGHV